MFDVIQSWWMAHPIAREAIFAVIFAILLFFLTPLLSPAVETFWKLWAIPPQRLNLWILKARLSSAELRLRRLLRLCSDTRYFVFTCFMGLGYLVLSSTCVTLSRIEAAVNEMGTPKISAHSLGLGFYMFILPAYWAMFQFLRKMNALSEAVSRPTKAKAKISSRIETLRKKLRPKGEASEGAALVEPEADRSNQILQGVPDKRPRG